MTSISSSAMFQRTSPREMLQNELLSEISSGAISAKDQDALSTALDSIDATLKSGRPSIGGKPPSPDEMKSKVDGLIQGQVDSGALTSEQAEELKSVFANAMPKGGPRGPGGPGVGGGPGGVGGVNESEDSEDSDNLAEILQKFITSLQESKSSASYGESGDKLLSDISSLIVDYKA